MPAIAIQSNQNDQHGGQSIPNFEYALAKGVKKTYKKNYRRNLSKALELLGEIENADQITSDVMAEIEQNLDLSPELANDNGYHEAEAELLTKEYRRDLVEKCQAYALKYAEKETDRATYQAMEAFIHNLNTMQSRAGAQMPFSSINYGTDTSPEGRMVMKNVLLATEAGLGNGETPIFPIHIFKVKEGVNYNDGDPNYDLFKLACRVSAKRLFPNFSLLRRPLQSAVL